MAGKPGRAAPNKISTIDHLRRGTFRADRHRQPPVGPPWEPSPDQIVTLGPAGKALFGRLQTAYAFNVCEGELIIEAAIIADRLQQLRARRDRLDDAGCLKSDRVEATWQRQLLGVLQALNVRAL